MKSLIFFEILIFCLFAGHVTAEMAIGGQWIEINAEAGFSPRQNHGVAVFDNCLWVIGGDANGNSTNDVWSSPDGKIWTLETEHAGFSPRSGHGVVVFDSQLWVIGGLSDGTAENDIWSSYDGKTWKLVTTNPGFDPRFFHGLVVFDDRLWVIGGMNEGRITLNDVWVSPDGKSWTPECEHAEFLARSGHGVAAFQNHIWVIGGFSYVVESGGFTVMQNLNDVWSSSDGHLWKLNNASAAFEKREFVPVAVMNDALWIPGGGGPVPYKTPMRPGMFAFNSVWSSGDGEFWTPDPEPAGFNPRYGQGVTSYDKGLWVIGGSTGEGIFKNDVWYKPFNSAPSVLFISDVTRGTTPLSVQFTDTTLGDVTGWQWDFGDGTIANTRNVTHVFVDPGSYTVVLTVFGPIGTNQTTSTIIVDPISVTPTRSALNPAIFCLGIFVLAFLAGGLRLKKN